MGAKRLWLGLLHNKPHCEEHGLERAAMSTAPGMTFDEFCAAVKMVEPGAANTAATLRVRYDVLPKDASGAVSVGTAGGALSVSGDSDQVKKDAMHLLRDAVAATLSRVTQIFSNWDANGDGKVSKKEFQKGLKAMNFAATPEIIDDLFDAIDTDSSGFIVYAELCAADPPLPWCSSRAARRAPRAAPFGTQPAPPAALLPPLRYKGINDPKLHTGQYSSMHHRRKKKAAEESVKEAVDLTGVKQMVEEYKERCGALELELGKAQGGGGGGLLARDRLLAS